MGRTIATSPPLAKGMARLADAQWKSFLSRFRSYSVTRCPPISLVLTFGRRSTGNPRHVAKTIGQSWTSFSRQARK
jgi:hypothetical protein